MVIPLVFLEIVNDWVTFILDLYLYLTLHCDPSDPFFSIPTMTISGGGTIVGG